MATVKSRKVIEVNVNPTIVQHAQQINTQLHTRVIEIGDWDMHTSGAGDGTTNVEVAMGIDFKKIRAISICIRHDSDTHYYFSPTLRSTTALDVGVYFTYIDGNGKNAIRLERVTGGSFDTTAFDSTSYNRGWITIWYTG